MIRCQFNCPGGRCVEREVEQVPRVGDSVHMDPDPCGQEGGASYRVFACVWFIDEDVTARVVLVDPLGPTPVDR